MIMRNIQIIHNPAAGEENTGKQELLESLNRAGHDFQYFSTDEKGWDSFYRHRRDAVLIAGGDGTIRKVADVILNRKTGNRDIPLYLKPLGTANNIARTLGVADASDTFTLNQKGPVLKFECGGIRNLKKEKFFLESVGLGIFPELMHQMRKDKNKDYVASLTLPKTIDILIDIAKSHKAGKAVIMCDGMIIKGHFLLVEVMNIQYIGPNIRLAPGADPSDGLFDLVMVPEKKRAELIDFLEKMKEGKVGEEKFAHILRSKKVKLKCNGGSVHADDILITNHKGKSFTLEAGYGSLDFVIST